MKKNIVLTILSIMIIYLGWYRVEHHHLISNVRLWSIINTQQRALRTQRENEVGGTGEAAGGRDI